MKRIIYLLLLGMVCCFSACDDVQVGYLESDNADYPVDTLFLFNVKERLTEYKEYEAKFNELAGPVNERLVEVKQEIAEKLEILYDIDDQVWSLQMAIDEGTATEEMKAAYDELQAKREVVFEEKNELEGESWDLRQELTQIAQDMGFDSAAEITDGAAKLENTIKYEIPWVTSPVEGILGTQPMSYSIGEVKNESLENAELFRQSLSIMGGGIMFVALDLKAPAGTYIVSVVVENEGQRALLEDAFTFIVEE